MTMIYYYRPYAIDNRQNHNDHKWKMRIDSDKSRDES